MPIQVAHLTKRFGEFVALDDVSLEIPDGSLTALLGPSGSGKTTLLRIIGGLEAPDAGLVILDGRDVTRTPPQDRGIGFVFQHYAPFRHMSVYDNVAFGLTIRRRPKAEIDRKVRELLALVQIGHLADRFPSQLSGGQRQRMALARALAVDPSMLLLDEPFGALDARVRKELRAWLRRLHDETQVTTVFVTHDQEEAMDVADHIVVMDHGRIQQEGSPRDVYEHPANAFVMGFIGPVTSVGEGWVRPHDIDLLADPTDGAAEVMIERVVHLGFEVRVELVHGDGTKVWVQMTRDEAEAQELAAGRIMWARARRVRRFDAGGVPIPDATAATVVVG